MEHPNKSFATNIDSFVCFLCNFEIDAVGKIGCAVLTSVNILLQIKINVCKNDSNILLYQGLIKTVSQILNQVLPIENNRNVLCKKCKKDIEDYGNLERRMTLLHNQIHSNYEATQNIRAQYEQEATLNDENLLEAADSSIDEHTMIEEALEDIDGIQVELSDTDELQEPDKDVEMVQEDDVISTSIIVMYGKDKDGRQQYFDTNIDNMVELITPSDEESTQNNKQIEEVDEMHDNVEVEENSLGDDVKPTEEDTDQNNEDGDEYLSIDGKFE
jgi:hypothetical protein